MRPLKSRKSTSSSLSAFSSASLTARICTAQAVLLDTIASACLDNCQGYASQRHPWRGLVTQQSCTQKAWRR